MTETMVPTFENNADNKNIVLIVTQKEIFPRPDNDPRTTTFIVTADLNEANIKKQIQAGLESSSFPHVSYVIGVNVAGATDEPTFNPDAVTHDEIVDFVVSQVQAVASAQIEQVMPTQTVKTLTMEA